MLQYSNSENRLSQTVSETGWFQNWFWFSISLHQSQPNKLSLDSHLIFNFLLISISVRFSYLRIKLVQCIQFKPKVEDWRVRTTTYRFFQILIAEFISDVQRLKYCFILIVNSVEFQRQTKKYSKMFDASNWCYLNRFK